MSGPTASTAPDTAERPLAAAGRWRSASCKPASTMRVARLPGGRRSRRAMRSVPCQDVTFKTASSTSASKPDHGADRLAGVHQCERLVDAFQRQFMGDERIEVDFTAHRLLDHPRQLRATLDPTEGRPAPHPPGHQLEWPRADFLPGASDADDHRLAPALVAALQRRTHHVDVADAFEAEVDAAIGELDDH